jgi:hypothetical protein
MLGFVDNAQRLATTAARGDILRKEEDGVSIIRVDKRKRHRVDGLGCGEQSRDEFLISLAEFGGLPPLHGNIENVQHSSTKIRTRFRTFACEKVIMR